MAQVTLRDYLQEIEDAISAERVDDALNKCQHVLVQLPEVLEVQRLLGEVYLAQGQVGDAQQSLDWVLTNDPENVIAYCDRALICERLSDFDTALDCYQQAYELSRGNSQIRQEFNTLSAKTGQQGFMFSRAGLARLYMRGGLLPQAVQEWETVLSVSPDRLDARTGLLEACWREGLYDRTEQLANQILQDVPGCLKALLLLAHMTAPRDMHQAQELIQRVETLDPDLVIAQELFEDMMVSQPGHPFLKLLRKSPAILDDSDDAVAALPSVPASEQPVVVPDALLYEAPTSNNLFSWSDLENWNGVDTLIKPKADEHPAQEDSTVSSWSNAMVTSSDSDSWRILEKPEEPQEQEDTFATVHNQDNFQFESWSHNVAEDAAAASHQPGVHQLSDLNHFAELNPDSVSAWNNTQDNGTADISSSWGSSSQEETPAWLNMLTQEERGDQQQSSGAVPSIQSEQQPSVKQSAIPTQQSVEHGSAVADTEKSWQDELQASSNTSEEEPFFFGPEWLKSLGATTMDSNSQEELVAATPALPVDSTVPPVTTSTTVELEPASETQVWSDDTSALPLQTEQGEQNLLTTLEDLEQDLRSQGFIPLEPNSLSAIAQAQQSPSSIEPQSDPVQQPEETYAKNSPQEATLSSALAQLGNFASPLVPDSYVSPASSTQINPDPVTPPAEPLWASELRSVPAPAPDVQEEQPLVASAHFDESASPVFSPPSVSFPNMSQELPVAQPNRVDAFPGPVFEPNQAPAVTPQSETQKVPVARSDAFYDSELETTMKRPAVRLQPIQQRSASQHSLPLPSTRGRGGEPQPAVGGAKDRLQSYQGRLVKGYQHQLVGDYDEAMQEYRIIIKSAPELLGEVISNVRALLKLAPRYSAGYRILGDAYMRQGEYLQAMEAYNKALTMAKKAKA